MRKPLLPGMTLALVATFGCGTTAVAQDQQLDTSEEHFSYGLGLMVGERLQSDGLEVDPDAFSLAVRDVLEGKEPRVPMEKIQQAFQEQQARQQQALAEAAQSNRKSGDAFRSEYAEDENTDQTDSGLLYRVLKAGSGEQPKADDQVTVQYRGTLIDGTEFDSSYSRGEPATFGVSDVIPGWQEALKNMREGAHWEVVIPPELAYGEQGAAGAIGPNETLVFDIKLLEVAQDGQ